MQHPIEQQPEPEPEVFESEPEVVESASKKKKNKKKKNKNKEAEPAKEPAAKIEVKAPAPKKQPEPEPTNDDLDQTWEQVEEEQAAPVVAAPKKQAAAPKKTNSYLDSLPEEIRASIFKANSANDNNNQTKKSADAGNWNDTAEVETNKKPASSTNSKKNKKSAAAAEDTSLQAPIKVEKKKVFVEHNIWAEMHEKLGASGVKVAISGNIIGNW